MRFATDQTRQTTLALLAECFAELGGVPAVVLSDRMACLKAGVVANVVVPHPEYVRFATFYGSVRTSVKVRIPNRRMTLHSAPRQGDWIRVTRQAWRPNFQACLRGIGWSGGYR